MIEELRRLLAEATPGPWRWDEATGYHVADAAVGEWNRTGHLYTDHEGLGTAWNRDADRDLIVAMHTALPLLLDVVEAAQEMDRRASVDGEDPEYIHADVALTDLSRLRAALDRLSGTGPNR